MWTMHRLVAFVCLVAAGSFSPPLLAFKRGMTPEGVPLVWKKNPIPYAVDARGMGDYFASRPTLGTTGSEFTALQGAFAAWQGVVCTGGAVGFRFEDKGRLPSPQIGYDKSCTSCNANVILFRFEPGSWKYDKLKISEVALTYDKTSGEIFDVDIELNAVDYVFSTQTSSPEEMRWDLQSVLSYEVGKLLGMGESEDKEATMFNGGNEKDISKRDLNPDDINGICTIYPPKPQNVPVYQQVAQDRALGCTSLPASSAFAWGLLLLLLLPLLRAFRSA